MPRSKKSVDELGQSLSDWHGEVIKIAHKHHLTEQQVRHLIERVGNDCEKLERAAGEISGRT